MAEIPQETINRLTMKAANEYDKLSKIEATLRFVVEASAFHGYMVNVLDYDPDKAFDKLIELMLMYKNHNIEATVEDT